VVKEAKSVVWDFGALITAQGLSFLLAVTYTAIVVRTLGPQRYGSLALLLGVMQFVFCLCVNWSGTAVLKFGKEELSKNGRMSGVFWARTLIIAILLSFAFLILFFIRPWLQNYLHIGIATFWLLPLLVLAYSLSDYGAWIMKTTNSIKSYACSLFLRQVILLILIWFAILTLTKISLSTIIMIEFFSYSSVALFVFFLIKKNVYLPFVLDKGKIKNILFYSWPLIFSLLSGYIVDWIDLFVIKLYFTFKETGVYQLAYRMYFYISGFLTSISTVLFPILIAASIQKKEDLIKDFYIRRFTPQITLFWSVIISLLLIFASPFFIKVFSQTYSEAIIPFKIICLGLAAQVIAYLYSSVLCTFTDLRKLAFVSISGAIINLMLDLILVPSLGINGAALATTATICFSVLAYVILVQRHYAMREFRAFYFLLLPVSTFILSLILKSIFIQIIFLLVAIIAFLSLSRRIGIFSKSDIILVEKINMPRLFKKAIIQTYASLSH